MRLKKYLVGAALVAMATCGVAYAAGGAQDYPTKPVRVVMPFPPGGPTDAIGRVITTEMSQSLGQQLFIDSKAGASGTIGAAEVARAPADGYTLLMNPSVQVIYPGMFKSLRFDPMGDFVPVGVLGTVPMVAIVPANSPYQSFRDLLAAARTQPEKFSFASPGAATLPHLVGELVNLTAKVKIQHIGYKGSGPALTDVAGGHVSLMYAPLAPAMPLIKSGQVRALAVTPAKRVPGLPEVPTIAESGLAGFDVVTWYGVWAPKGTSPAVVTKLNAAMRAASKSPKVLEVLDAQGTYPSDLDPAQFAKFAAAENRKWLKVMADADIKPE